jgi:glutamate decarboxylase
MPDDASSVAVMRAVVREGFSRDLADALIAELREAIDYLDETTPTPAAKSGFSHT